MERFIQTLQQECLDFFIVFGEQHMDHIVSEMVAYYHEERPHQALENGLLMQAAPGIKLANLGELPETEGAIDCRQRLGGLLKHYYRNAA